MTKLLSNYNETQNLKHQCVYEYAIKLYLKQNLNLKQFWLAVVISVSARYQSARHCAIELRQSFEFQVNCTRLCFVDFFSFFRTAMSCRPGAA